MLETKGILKFFEKKILGKILKNDLLYDRLDSATNLIEILLNDIKQNPKRYVHFSLFGKKEKSENK